MVQLLLNSWPQKRTRRGRHRARAARLERLEEIEDVLVEGVVVQGDILLPGVLAGQGEPRLPEDLEVVGPRRFAHLDDRADLPAGDAPVDLPQVTDDLKSDRIRQGLEHLDAEFFLQLPSELIGEQFNS